MESKKGLILSLVGQNLSIAQIAEKVGCSDRYVRRLIPVGDRSLGDNKSSGNGKVDTVRKTPVSDKINAYLDQQETDDKMRPTIDMIIEATCEKDLNGNPIPETGCSARQASRAIKAKYGMSGMSVAATPRQREMLFKLCKEVSRNSEQQNYDYTLEIIDGELTRRNAHLAITALSTLAKAQRIWALPGVRKFAHKLAKSLDLKNPGCWR